MVCKRISKYYYNNNQIRKEEIWGTDSTLFYSKKGKLTGYKIQYYDAVKYVYPDKHKKDTVIFEEQHGILNNNIDFYPYRTNVDTIKFPPFGVKCKPFYVREGIAPRDSINR